MKKNKKKRKYIIFFFIVYSLYIFINQQIDLYNVNLNIDRESLNLINQIDENEKLQDELEKVKTKIYYEKLAREKLDFIKKDEVPVINSNVK